MCARVDKWTPLKLNAGARDRARSTGETHSEVDDTDTDTGILIMYLRY